MRISFHMGPHKTGTTSIQTYLLNQLGSEHPKGPVWYPGGDAMGPGHTHLSVLMNGKEFSPRHNPMKETVQTAIDAGVEHLILSSENFSYAYPDRLCRYADALAGQHLVLISTQNSAVNRAVSFWQEMVKHRHTHSIADSTERLLAEIGYQPDLLSSFASALSPASIAIVYSSTQDPAPLLIKRMRFALGIESITSEAVPEIRKNTRLSLIEVELMRKLNILIETHTPDLEMNSYFALREVLLHGFAQPAWKDQCPRIAIEPPEALIAAARQRAREIAEDIQSLERRWPVTSYGLAGVVTEEI